LEKIRSNATGTILKAKTAIYPSFIVIFGANIIALEIQSIEWRVAFFAKR